MRLLRERGRRGPLGGVDEELGSLRIAYGFLRDAVFFGVVLKCNCVRRRCFCFRPSSVYLFYFLE